MTIGPAWRHRRAIFIASILSAALFAANARAQDVGTGADVMAAWSTRANSIATEKQDPPLSRARGLAILHIAMFEAMNAAEAQEKQAANPSAGGSSDEPAAAAAAVAAAAHDVLVALHPNQSAELSAALVASLTGITNGVPKVRGYLAGKKAAAAVLAVWLSTATGKTDVRQIGGLPVAPDEP